MPPKALRTRRRRPRPWGCTNQGVGAAHLRGEGRVFDRLTGVVDAEGNARDVDQLGLDPRAAGELGHDEPRDREAHASLAHRAEEFRDYVRVLKWTEQFAAENRQVMLAAVLRDRGGPWASVHREAEAVNCHHNYVQREHHFGIGCVADAEGRRLGARRRARDHPGFSGHPELHRPGEGEPGEFSL